MATLGEVPVVVRSALPLDASALARCHNACWREAYRGQLSSGFLDALDDDERAVWWQRNLVESSERVVIAEMGREIVGFAGSGPNLDDPPLRNIQLHMLYVRQAQYGTGVGKRLFDTAVADQPCSLWVAQDNRRAINFYLRQGFISDNTCRTIPELENIVTIRMVR